MASQETDTFFVQQDRTEERMYQADEVPFSQGEDSSSQESNTPLALPLDADKRTIGHHHGTLLARQDAANGVAWRPDDELRDIASEQFRYNLVGLDNTYKIVEFISYCTGCIEGYRTQAEQTGQEQAA